ncbi:MAG: 3-isopropylmalate dehydrogenase [Bacteroides sp.]|nr:MAG: 3-isopropylmalate dehydrogenase [Bacteroides sp.]
MKNNEYLITVLKGDGIGPEVIDESLKVLNAICNVFNYNLKFQYEYIGGNAIEKFGISLPKKTIDNSLKSNAILLGSIGDPKYNINCNDTPENGLLKLRSVMGTYCNIRPIKIYNNLAEKSCIKHNLIKNVDFIIYRELTGGIYFGEKKYDKEYAYDTCTYTYNEIERISHIAFRNAFKRKKQITLIDKANVLSTSKLWRNVVSNIAEKYYSDIKVNYMFIDNAAMQMIINPQQFDIILTDNMFGDILSDEASALVGSLGLLPSSSIGNNIAIYEPVHGSYPEAAGKNIANPIGSILSAAMMLYDFKLYKGYNAILSSVQNSIDNNIVTQDINSNSSYMTYDIGDYISNYIINNFK